MTRRFYPFEIQIEIADADNHRVEARFLGSIRSETISSDLALLKPREIQQARSWLERGFIDIEYAKDFGGRLFKTFFQGEILDLLRQAMQRVEPEDGLRLMLDLPMPGELNNLPWELLYDSEGGYGFLSRSDSVALVRHFTDLPLSHELPEEGPLRVLLVAASPQDRPLISHEKEGQAILNSLRGRRLGFLEMIRIAYQHVVHSRSLTGLGSRLRQRSLVEFDSLPHATRGSIQRKLLEARNSGQGYHVIHFAGHGESNEDGSFLVLENEAGTSDLISAEEFAELVDGSEINLVILNACKSAASEDAIMSLAEWPLRRGIPAVIGMQVPVLDRAAVEFARELYGLWATGEPLESALGLARRLISREKRNQAADWSIPVLYMGPEEGLTLELKAPPVQIPKPVRILRWSFTALISLIGTVTLLLSVPDTATALRKQVPYLRCWYPAKMSSDTNSFNIIVTKFPVLDEKDHRIAGNEGLFLANHTYDLLTQAFSGIDIKPDIRPPAETCSILGSRDERQDQARKLANDVDADMVIYGVVKKTPSGIEFEPEFYVSYRGFEQAEEIVGEHRLGDPVGVTELSKEFVNVRDTPLGGRFQALVNITIGLAHYSLDNMLEAANYFEKANEAKGWPESEPGREVIHLMWGNALARHASQTVLDVIAKKTSYDEWRGYLDEARRQYEIAQELKPDYPRAVVGLASVDVTIAQGEPGNPNTAIDLLLLDEADRLYDSVEQMQTAEELMIPAKVHFGRGQIDLARAREIQRQAQASGEISQGDELVQPAKESLQLAEQEFNAMIDIYQNLAVARLKSRIEDLASHANANLAAIRLLQKDMCGAIPYIIEAKNLATLYYRWRYWAFLGQTYESLGDTEQALIAYKEGKKDAYIYASDNAINTLNARISTLESQTPVTTPIPCPTTTTPTLVP